jgi:large subunit ribosomal protein L24
MLIRKKDKVEVIAGRDKGKRGEVNKVIPGKNRVVVAGVNIVTKHERPGRNKPGGIQKVESGLDASNVMLVCPKCDKAVRPKADRLETGERIRKCRKCGEAIL